MISSGHLTGHSCFVSQSFTHSQIETPHGPVRQQNSGWFRYEPKIHRLTAMGTYPSTNPWGVTFDPWGNHVASHPIFCRGISFIGPTIIRSNMHGLRACRPIQAPVVRHLLIALDFQKNSKAGLSKHGTSQRTELKFIDGLKMTLASTSNT